MNRQLYALFYDAVPHWYLLFSTMCSIFLFLPWISLFLRRNRSILKSKVLLHSKAFNIQPFCNPMQMDLYTVWLSSPTRGWFVWAARWRWISIHADRMGARYRSNLHDAVSRAQQCCQQNQTHSPCISSYNQCHSGVLWGTMLFKHHHSWLGTVNFRFTFGAAPVFLARKIHTLGFNLFCRIM